MALKEDRMARRRLAVIPHLARRKSRGTPIRLTGAAFRAVRADTGDFTPHF